jgi:hypothetical protein
MSTYKQTNKYLCRWSLFAFLMNRGISVYTIREIINHSDIGGVIGGVLGIGVLGIEVLGIGAEF